MSDLNRRAFNQGTLGSLLTFSLLETLFANDLFAEEIKPVTAQWLGEVNQLSLDLKGQKLEQIAWQKQVEALLDKVDLKDLMAFIDFDNLTASIKFRERGERSLRPKFPEVEGLPTKLVFGNQLFAVAKNRSVVPHGHNNMATAFIVLKGEFHGRHYDRLADENDGQHIIIRPTIDRTFAAGEYSTISDDKDNVHWFKATSETAYVFNFHVMSVRPGRTGRVYLDPNGEKLSDGRIRAPRLNSAKAYELYG